MLTARKATFVQPPHHVPAIPAQHQEQVHERLSDATDPWKDRRLPEAMQPLDSFSWREGNFEVTALLMDRLRLNLSQCLPDADFAPEREDLGFIPLSFACEGEADLLALHGPVLRAAGLRHWEPEPGENEVLRVDRRAVFSCVAPQLNAAKALILNFFLAGVVLLSGASASAPISGTCRR